MQIVQAPRALAILYSILIQRADSHPWLLPANICPIVPITFLKARVPFEFVDISAATLHMDLEQAKGRIKTRKFGGLLYAHTYGEPSTPHDFFTSLKNLDSELIIADDRCLCIPDFEPVSPADVILYSTGYAKIVELNFGGYAFVNGDLNYQPAHLPFNRGDHEELEKCYKDSIEHRSIFFYRDGNWLNTDAPLPTWYDYRQKIENGQKSSLEHRAVLNQIYTSRLPKEIQLSVSYQTWRFNIRVKDKMRMRAAG
ncbi:MAG: hypothetical protein HYR93_01275 [Chloroflexi bacterium]|nr:hypothetical protein [Chloroflexota bacterium]